MQMQSARHTHRSYFCFGSQGNIICIHIWVICSVHISIIVVCCLLASAIIWPRAADVIWFAADRYALIQGFFICLTPSNLLRLMIKPLASSFMLFCDEIQSLIGVTGECRTIFYSRLPARFGSIILRLTCRSRV